MPMPSKTISLEQGAYETLARAKRPGESFSDVVRRLAQGDRPSLLEFVGLFSPETAQDLKATFLRMRRDESELEPARIKRLWEHD